MSNTYFSFKRFTVRQSRSAMKVGTDGVLLGAWCSLPGTAECRLLDIGTGTGLIALMLSQRAPGAQIDALEPEVDACRDAAANFAASPWPERLHLYRTTLQEYAAGPRQKYDSIVSNPPYFVDSLQPPDPSRGRARHAERLSYADLLRGVQALLSPEGVFSLILPAEESLRFSAEADGYGLFLQRSLEICTTPRSGVVRLLMEWGFQPPEQPLPPERLLIHPGGTPEYGAEYRALTRDFYLYF